MQQADIRLLRGVALAALGWFLPAFLLWYLLLTPVLMPVMQVTADFLLHQSFTNIQARATQHKPDEWHISTQILMDKQPDNPNKRHLLNLKVQRNMPTFTFGLPILWALLLAIPHRRWRNLAIGTGLVTLSFILAAWLALSHQLIKSLSDGQLHYVFVTASISHRVEPFSPWLAQSLGLLLTLVVYFVALLLPAGLAYGLNQQWWQVCFYKRDE